MTVDIPLFGAVGGTPLVEIPGFARTFPGLRLFAKLECANPGGSLKDRPVARIVRSGLAAGCLGGGRHLLDAVSGNAGVAYAMMGAAAGVPVTLVMPGNIGREHLLRIRAHGAEVVFTDPAEGMSEADSTCQRMASDEPARYWHADLRRNQENRRAHTDTGNEILKQLAAMGIGPPDILIAGVGTGGTLAGLADSLRQANPGLRVQAVFSDGFPGIPGLSPGECRPPPFFAETAMARSEASTEDALHGTRRLAESGLFAGPASGASYHAAWMLGQGGETGTAVIILGDRGENYLDTDLWRNTPPLSRERRRNDRPIIPR